MPDGPDARQRNERILQAEAVDPAGEARWGRLAHGGAAGRGVAAAYTREAFEREAANLLAPLRTCDRLGQAREALHRAVSQVQLEASSSSSSLSHGERVVVRDCARAWRGIVRKRSDLRAGFSVTEALWDIALGRDRPDLQPGFFAEMIHLVRGIEGRALAPVPDADEGGGLTGRDAAVARSRSLDALWARVDEAMSRFADGLSDESVARRAERRSRILTELGAGPADWESWQWQVRNVVTDVERLERLVPLTASERSAVAAAVTAGLPFGVTPYYVSLMDDDPTAGRDLAVRAQVLPPADYVDVMARHHGERELAFDFMLERDTSPIDLVTRRYPAIAILKPYNTCPQICVYCQRNWEIDQAMSPHALAPDEQLEAACQWIEEHPAIREVLVTGGDPLTLGDGRIERLLGRLAHIEHVDLIRVGSRLPVTVPMRITPALAEMLGRFRLPGRREVCLVTHVEHPYEITPEFVGAVDRLRRQGIGVYNQHVYTAYVSRRFEAVRLRMLLRRCGVDPYYTFVPKGKDETRSYRVPLARLMQEQKEEARLLPGLRRTDEVVYNVPGLGKNNIRAFQDRDLLSIRPDGARVYLFHPWEKRLVEREPYVGTEVPILDYLDGLAAIGEEPRDYESIWAYF